MWRILTSSIKSIELAILFDCNRRCPGCYARNLREDQKLIKLTTEDVKNICDKYKPAHINLTGGEPLIHPQILDIIRVIPKSVIVSLVTNGDMFWDKNMKFDFKLLKDLKEAGLNTIQISYGFNYNFLDNQILATFAKKQGLNVCLSVTNIYKERDLILDAIKIAERENFHVLFNTPGVGLEDFFDYQTYLTYRSHPLVREDNMFWAGKDVCPAGIKKFYITADKSIYPCDRFHDKKYESYEEMKKEFKEKTPVYCRRYEQQCKSQ